MTSKPSSQLPSSLMMRQKRPISDVEETTNSNDKDKDKDKPNVKDKEGPVSKKPHSSSPTPTDVWLSLPTNPLTTRLYSSSYHSILSSRRRLPIFDHRHEFFSLLDSHPILILVGETGSGKTTQIPQFCLHYQHAKIAESREKGIPPSLYPFAHGMIGCTQPRRVAAMSVSQRVSNEMDVELGRHVGYSIRFEHLCGNDTKVKYLTDGMLLREAMSDPLLSQYSIVVLDEAHERTVATDILMGLVKEILVKRPEDFKLIVMSATLDAVKFQKHFNAPLMKVPGRLHPVEIFYSSAPERDYLDAAIRTVLEIHEVEDEGDILVFLTGEQEIEETCRKLTEKSEDMMANNRCGPLMCVPLYSSLPPKQQQRIFDPAPPPRPGSSLKSRKCVVATNIAETSLTIDGIVYVVDPGFCKQNVYDPRLRMESLLVTQISKASAQQRAGRAGRTRPGKCFRLYTEQDFHRELIPQTHPEMQRTSLTSVVLQLLKLGVRDLVRFDYIDPPAPETMMRALEQLHYLGAIDDDGNLTKIGVSIAEMPLDPQLSVMLISSSRFQCSHQVLSIAAMLSVPPVFLRPFERRNEADAAHAEFHHLDGDHMMLLQIYEEYEYRVETENDSKWCWNHYFNDRSLKSATNVRTQLKGILEKVGCPIVKMSRTDPKYAENIKKSILSGFFMQTAFVERGGQYSTVRDHQSVKLHPQSCLRTVKPEWIVYHEFVTTTASYLRTVTQVRGEWLIELAPTYFATQNYPEGGDKRMLVRYWQEKERREGKDGKDRERNKGAEIREGEKEKDREKEKKSRKDKHRDKERRTAEHIQID